MNRDTLLSAHLAGLTIVTAVLSSVWQTNVGAETTTSPATMDVIPIVVDETLSVSHGAAQPISYRFAARPGDTYLIEVSQQGLDFIVTVESPDGTAESYNSPLRRDEREFVLLESAAMGDYRVIISSKEQTHAVGTHALRVSRLTAVDAEDRRFIEAWSLMTEAAAAHSAGDRDRGLQALDAYQHAAQVWAELSRTRERAQAVYSAAMIEYEIFYNWSGAAKLAQKAAEIYQNSGEPGLHGNALLLQAAALIEAANELDYDDAQATFDTALTLFDEARTIHEKIGNAYDLAQVNINSGLTHFYMGDWELARISWEQGASQFASLGEWREELNARQNQAVIDGLQGYNARAIETLQYIVDKLPEGQDPDFMTTVLDNLAENHRLFGNYEEALQTYSSALDTHRRFSDSIGEAYSLRGIGNTYYSIGDLDLAAKYLEQALPLANEANDGRSQQTILTRLGDIAFLQADYSSALELHRAALDITVANPDRAHRQVLVAKDLAALNRHDEALLLANEARALAEDAEAVGTIADALMQIGRSYLIRDEALKSMLHFEDALGIYESLGLRAGQADAFNGLASSAHALGRLDDAVRYGQESLTYIESIRERVAAPELRALYSAARRGYYEMQINFLVARAVESRSVAESDAHAALATSERSRSRMVMDLLREASVQSRAHLDPGLLGKQRDLYEELAAKRYQRDRLLEKHVLDAAAKQTVASLLNDMTELENELNLLETDLRRSSPEYVRIGTTETLGAKQLQELLDPDSVLLQYSLGDDRSFVWAVTDTSIKVIELADRSRIHQTALRVFASLQSYDPSQSAKRRLQQDLQQLSDSVLGPAGIQLLGKKRVLLALDGALQYVPFGVLPMTIDGLTRPLLETHEIVEVPSMSVVTALRGRDRKTISKTIAVFADPVVGETDPRLDALQTDATNGQLTPASFLTRSSVDSSLTRLASTAQEARAIAELVPAEARYVAQGFAASRSQVISMDLAEYRFLHFATHGLVDSRYPVLSALVLSRYDERGDLQDGLLRLYDIAGLELNADLVVLSACNTALGREISGEGLIGLAQGFMYAGARSLLVSLWQVSDRATAELMTRFYQNMLRQDLAPAQALRAAQISLAAERRWSHPYFWGAFVLLGDWT
jgi:CHAT domain-containing protein